ncbi:mRNA (2'-O-methyladenosine-N(6)-)-methyltransferase [Podochytrium sp. JEL0797]|nr:mRNA (2'-O-methyladenosine-N(6)-)-methyltransferase [Podochytrium sp. JEL0797]
MAPDPKPPASKPAKPAHFTSAKTATNNYQVLHSLHQVVALQDSDFHRFSPLLTSGERAEIESERKQEDEDGIVWDESVVDTMARYSKYALRTTTAGTRFLKVEEKRQQLDRKLRRKFKQLLLKHELAPPIQAFERWVFNAIHKSSAKQRKDPLLPFNILVEEGLVSDLLRAGMSEKDAKVVARELGKESTVCVQELLTLQSVLEKESEEETVTITNHATSIDVTFGAKSFCKLAPAHYEKLQALFAKYSPSAPASQFPNALLSLLMRYQSLLGHGFQSALAPVAFNVLHREFGVDFECFASPLNSRWGAHCSAFADTDAPFGSLGDFFAFQPYKGSFQVNPPFVRPILEKAVEHVLGLLERAEKGNKALSFVVVIPGWEECLCWGAVKTSLFLRGETVIPGEHHGFLDGAQHQRTDRYRPSPYPTGVFILQTRKGAEKWAVTDKKMALVRYAMMCSLPRAGEAARRVKAGRGFSAVDGGGGVYKGKSKNKRVWGDVEEGADSGEVKSKKGFHGDDGY